MSSQIWFRFKAAKESDSILFEGTSLPLDALKRAIIDKKGLGDRDLVVTDSQTNEGACAGALPRLRLCTNISPLRAGSLGLNRGTAAPLLGATL
jgi:hypothetical protein